MPHMTREDLLARLDGAALTPAAEDHLRRCARCRDEVASFEAILHRMCEADAPEPSPLFWDHLASRVRTAVAQEPGPSRGARARLAWRWWAPASGLAAAVTALLLAVVAPVPPLAPEELLPDPAPTVLVTAADEGPSDAWELVVELAVNEGWEDTEGLWPAPASAELAATELPAEDQARLMQLLSDELTRSSP
jgi:hypothetical protein